AVTSPLYWFTAARPLSDMTGLVAAVAVQAITLSATTPLGLAFAGFCAALAVGLRSQVVWLTTPLLVLAVLRQRDRDRGRAIGHTIVAFAIGILLWAVPLMALSGGPAAYWRALFSQGSEDLSNIQMLWTTPTPRTLVSAFYY